MIVILGTTRRGTATPVHRPQRPAGSTHSSTRGLRPPEQLERPAGFPSSDKTLGEAPVNHAWPWQMAGGDSSGLWSLRVLCFPFFLPPTLLSAPPHHTHIEPILKKHPFTVSPILHFPRGPILSHTGPCMSQWRTPCRPPQRLFPSES